MIKPTFFPKPPRTDYEFQEGESIERKVQRIVGNNEPITDGAPIIYTKREDGVLPGFNIRTDRWEIAQETMNAIAQQNIAKSKSFGLQGSEKETVLGSPEEQQKPVG